MSKQCQNCGAELADNMNFCPNCHAKYQPQGGGAPADVEKILQILIQGVSNPQCKYSATNRGNGCFELRVNNPLANGKAEIRIENNGGGCSARIVKISTSPSAMGWFCLIFAFYIMVPVYFLLFRPLMKRMLKGLVFSLNGALRHPNAFLLPNTTGSLRGRSAAEVAQLVFGGGPAPVENGTRIGLPGNLDPAAVQGAVSMYAQGVRPEDIICMIDRTPSGGMPGEYGAIFTTERVYFRYNILNIKVAGKTEYSQITGGLFANASIRGAAFKYNAGLYAGGSIQNNVLWGIIPGTPSGDIPEPALNLSEKLLTLVRGMQM